MSTSSRLHPSAPIVGVGAVILTPAREIILVRRASEPLAGEWSLPGGAVELGETLRAAVAREALEETGLIVEVGPLVELLDRVFRDEEGRVSYHYVLADFLCRPVGGVLTAGTDALDVAAVAPAELERWGLAPLTTAVIDRALVLAGEPGPNPPHAGTV